MTEDMVFDYSAAVAMLDRITLSEPSVTSGGAGTGAIGTLRTGNGAASAASSAQSSNLPALSPAVAAAAAATQEKQQHSRSGNRGGSGPTGSAGAGSGSNGTTGAMGSGGVTPPSANSAAAAKLLTAPRRSQKVAAPWGEGDAPSQTSAPAVMAESSSRKPAQPPPGAALRASSGRLRKKTNRPGAAGRWSHQPPPNAAERGLGTSGKEALDLQPMYCGRPQPPQEVEVDNHTAVQSMSSVSNPSGASGSGSFGSRSHAAKSNAQEDHPPPPISVGGGLPVVTRRAGKAGQLPPTVEESIALEQLAAAEAAGTASVPYSSAESSSMTMSTNPSSGMMRMARVDVTLQQDAELPPSSLMDHSSSEPSSGDPTGPSPASTEEGTQAAHRAALGATAATRMASNERLAQTLASRRASNERQAPTSSRRATSDRQQQSGAVPGRRTSTNRSLFRRASGEKPQHLRQPAAPRRSSSDQQRQAPSARRVGHEQQRPQPQVSSRRASNDRQPQAQTHASRRSSNEQQPSPPFASRRSSNDHTRTRRTSNEPLRMTSRRANNEQQIAESRLKMLGNSTPSLAMDSGVVNGKPFALSSSVAHTVVPDEIMHMSLADMKYNAKDILATEDASGVLTRSSDAEGVPTRSSASPSQVPTASMGENGGTGSGGSASGAPVVGPNQKQNAIVSISYSGDGDGDRTGRNAPGKQGSSTTSDGGKLGTMSGGGAVGRPTSVENGEPEDGGAKKDGGTGTGATKARPGLMRKMSVQEMMLERELTGLNEEFNKSKESRRASLSLASVAARTRRSSAHGSSSGVFHDSGTTASITTGEGGKSVQFVVAGGDSAVGGDGGVITAESEKRQMWNDWYERRRRSRSPGAHVAMGKDWREVLIDGIAGFGKHAPRCVLGDVAVFLRGVAANDNWRDRGEEEDTHGNDGPVQFEEIEAIAEDEHSLSTISDGGGGHSENKERRSRAPVPLENDLTDEGASNSHPQYVAQTESTDEPLEDAIKNVASGETDDFSDEEHEKRQHFPRRPSLGFDTRGIHRPDVIPLQVGLEDDTVEGDIPSTAGRDIAPVEDADMNQGVQKSSEGVTSETCGNDGIVLQSSIDRPNRRMSNENTSGILRHGGRVPKRGSMDSGRRSSMGSSRPGITRLASNKSAFVSVVSDATTIEAGHSRPRRGSGGPLAMTQSLSQALQTQPDDGVECAGAVSSPNCHTTFDLPHHGSRQSALLFVDISGFTKLSTLLDIEDLSRAINSYFDLIVTEVLSHGGDVLKFAGDALFAEWQVTASDEDTGVLQPCNSVEPTDFGSLVGNKDGTVAAHGSSGGRDRKRGSEGLTLTECVMAASFCGASICQKCSGYKVYASSGESKNSRSRRSSAGARKKRSVAKLDVHCGIGVGQMVGLHVSNSGVVEGRSPSEKRREFLFLGNPIDQVAKAEGIAQTGELVASPEVVKILSAVCNIPDSILSCDGPSVVARRSECFITSKIPWEPAGLAFAVGPLLAGSDLPSYESLDAMCDDLDSHTLEMLRDQLSLYVHPVVRGDQLAKAREDTVQPLSQEQHRAEAELRSVYVMFILPLISAQVSGDPDVDRELFTKLSDIMRVTNRELVKFSGHLRQFIVDDKGVVLIGTFGLRGSTFPNMVPENALPATLSIHKALKSELNVDNKVGATFGKVYCGVVGGVHRHEFAVLGPSVNLAARLMASKENTGVLVDEAVQSHAKAKFSFRSHSHVTAKGYAKPVPTFEPLDSINQKIDDSIGIVGRKLEIKEVMDVTRKIIEVSTPIPSQLVFLGGESGVGKTAIIACLVEKIKTFCALYYKHVAICRSSSRENEQLVPLSGFKSVLLYAVREYCLFDGTVSIKNQRDSLSSIKRSMRRDSGRFRRRDSMASQASNIEIPYMHKIRWVCGDLGYDPAYADIVGARLLGLEDADAGVCTVDGEVPKLEKIVEFLAASFIRFTKHAGVTLITIDDVQWIDALSWKVVHALWEKGEDMLILGGLRESDLGGRRRRSSAREWDEEEEASRFTNISLGALERADVKVLISKALYYHESSIDDDFVNEVYEKTGGIPVFALELLENIKRNDLVEVQESGLLGLKSTPQGEQGKTESQGPGVVDELFLQRLDALDLPVRKVLQSCAVLGMEFFLSDVLRVNPEYESAETLQKSLDSAVAERILVEDMEDGSDEDSVKGHCGDMKNARLASSNRSFRFSQAMWRDIVLRTMLKDRQMDLHRNIAKAMESDGVSEFSDTRTLLKLFDHWKACCDFLKAAPLALAIGARLEEWESSQQSLDLYCNALAMWRTDTKVNASLETLGAWYEPSLSSNALAFVVRLKTRVGKCLHDIGDEKKGALAYRDAYLIMTKLPASKRVDRSLIFPVISGLWLSIPWDQIVCNDSNFSVEQELVQRFVDEAQAYGDPIHCCRALAMQGSLYSRMSDFPRALEVQRQLECVYSYSEHSSGIFDAYGSDFAALSFGNSVQWYDLVSDEAMASKQMDFVLNKLLPKFHPVAVHDSMGVLFPVLMVMKSKAMAKDAILMFQNHVLDRFKALGIKSTYFYPLYKPTSLLLEIARRDDSGEDGNGMLEEVQEWAMTGEKISPIPMLERNGQFIQGEICWRLARRKALEDPIRLELIRRGTSLLKRVMKKVQHDGSYAFMVKEAYFVYTDLQKMKEAKPEPPAVPPTPAESGCSCSIS